MSKLAKSDCNLLQYGELQSTLPPNLVKLLCWRQTERNNPKMSKRSLSEISYVVQCDFSYDADRKSEEQRKKILWQYSDWLGSEIRSAHALPWSPLPCYFVLFSTSLDLFHDVNLNLNTCSEQLSAPDIDYSGAFYRTVIYNWKKNVLMPKTPALSQLLQSLTAVYMDICNFQ